MSFQESVSPASTGRRAGSTRTKDSVVLCTTHISVTLELFTSTIIYFALWWISFCCSPKDQQPFASLPQERQSLNMNWLSGNEEITFQVHHLPKHVRFWGRQHVLCCVLIHPNVSTLQSERKLDRGFQEHGCDVVVPKCKLLEVPLWLHRLIRWFLSSPSWNKSSVGWGVNFSSL